MVEIMSAGVLIRGNMIGSQYTYTLLTVHQIIHFNSNALCTRLQKEMLWDDNLRLHTSICIKFFLLLHPPAASVSEKFSFFRLSHFPHNKILKVLLCVDCSISICCLKHKCASHDILRTFNSCKCLQELVFSNLVIYRLRKEYIFGSSMT